MPGKDLIEVDSYTSKVHVPLTGEPVMAADLENAAQALANRAKNHETHGLWDTLKSSLGSDKIYKLRAGGELFLTTTTSVIRGTASKIKGSFTVEAAMTFVGGIVVNTLASVFNTATTFNSSVDVNGAFTASDGAAFPLGSVVQFAENDIHVGDTAYSTRRVGSTPGVDATIQPWKLDLHVIPNIGSEKSLTLTHPPGNACFFTSFIMPSQGAGTMKLFDGATQIARIGVGNLNGAIIAFDGANYRLVASS